jgi:hypothetical protein
MAGRISRLLQLRVFRLGLFQYMDVAVGVFPESEEILISCASLGDVSLHRAGAPHLKTRECALGRVSHDPCERVSNRLVRFPIGILVDQ